MSADILLATLAIELALALVRLWRGRGARVYYQTRDDGIRRA